MKRNFYSCIVKGEQILLCCVAWQGNSRTRLKQKDSTWNSVSTRKLISYLFSIISFQSKTVSKLKKIFLMSRKAVSSVTQIKKITGGLNTDSLGKLVLSPKITFIQLVASDSGRSETSSQSRTCLCVHNNAYLAWYRFWYIIHKKILFSYVELISVVKRPSPTRPWCFLTAANFSIVSKDTTFKRLHNIEVSFKTAL